MAELGKTKPKVVLENAGWTTLQKTVNAVAGNGLGYCGGYTSTPCPRKKQATLIFAITLPSVEIFLQFLKHDVQDNSRMT